MWCNVSDGKASGCACKLYTVRRREGRQADRNVCICAMTVAHDGIVYLIDMPSCTQSIVNWKTDAALDYILHIHIRSFGSHDTREAWTIQLAHTHRMWRICDVSVMEKKKIRRRYLRRTFMVDNVSSAFTLPPLVVYIPMDGRNFNWTYLRCKQHGRVFAGQFVDRVSIRWDHKWHKSMDVHFQSVESPAGWPVDCWKIGNYFVIATWRFLVTKRIWFHKYFDCNRFVYQNCFVNDSIHLCVNAINGIVCCSYHNHNNNDKRNNYDDKRTIHSTMAGTKGVWMFQITAREETKRLNRTRNNLYCRLTCDEPIHVSLTVAAHLIMNSFLSFSDFMLR